MTLDDLADERAFIARIRARFADDATRTDERMRQLGYEDFVGRPYAWVEYFADRTTDAMRARDWARVKAHTEFLSAEYRNGSEDVRRLVDVSYAESLMWDLEPAAKIAAWPHIAKEVRALHERMWGDPVAK